MKLKTTKKAIRESGQTILQIGYCNAQFLLRFQNAFAYSERAEGWACDFYEINGVIISTGYSPIGKKVDYKLIQEYDNKARQICEGYSRNYKNKKAAVNALLYEFVEKAAA